MGSGSCRRFPPPASRSALGARGKGRRPTGEKVCLGRLGVGWVRCVVRGGRVQKRLWSAPPASNLAQEMVNPLKEQRGGGLGSCDPSRPPPLQIAFRP